MDTINIKGPHLGFSGEWRAILRNEDESIISDSGWEPNLITTRGEFLYSNVIGGTWFDYAHIGSSGAAPSIGDTILGAWLAKVGTYSVSDPVSGSYNGGINDYERWATRTWRFGAGVGTGTVEEMGLGTNSGLEVSYLFSHHLLTVPIDKGVGQSLDVSYRITIWPSLIETTNTPVLIGGVNYTCDTSFYNATNIGGSVSPFQICSVHTTNLSPTYDGDKAALTDSQPAGDSGVSGVSSMNTNGTGISNVSTFYSLTQGVTDLGIVRTAVFRLINYFQIQTQFNALDGPAPDTGIPKSAAQELTLNWQITWGERP
jgi:hypothetical protein